MYVYVISEGVDGPCKIGFGQNPLARLEACRIGNPRPLRIAFQCASIRPRYVERIAHVMLAGKRVSGEWFWISEVEAQRLVLIAARRAGDTPKAVKQLVRRLEQDKTNKLVQTLDRHPLSRRPPSP